MPVTDLTELTSSNVSNEHKAMIINSLLKCVTMSDRSRRNAVLGMLDPSITANISRSDVPTIDLSNIVTTCLRYQAGLAKLVSIVRFFERDSIDMRSLDEVLRRVASSLKKEADGWPHDMKEGDPPPPPRTESDTARATRARQPDPAAGPASAGDDKQRRLKVFLSYASEDREAVLNLYDRLRATAGIEPWIDCEDLLPGQKWEDEIPKVVRKSDVIIICVSQVLSSRAGYIQKEINLVLDLAEEQPEGSIFLIPARLEQCEVPARLGPYTWVDLFEPRGFDKLMRSLRSRAAAIGVDLQ